MTCDMLKPCRLSAALISNPRGKKTLDLDKAARKLEKKGYTIRIKTERILIVRNENGLETSIYPSGKLLFKTRDEKIAREECRRIRAIIGP